MPELTHGSNTLAELDATGGLISGGGAKIECAGGLLYASSGTVLRPETPAVVTNIPDLSAGALMKPDPAGGLLSFLTQDSGNWIVRQYAHSNYALAREFRVPGVNGTPASLARWGTGGLGFVTSSNQLFLLNPSLGNKDLAIEHTAWPTQAMAGQPFRLALTVTNQGPNAAMDVFVTDTPPSLTTVLGAEAAQGTNTVLGGNIVFALGTIPANSAVGLSVRLEPTNAMETSLTNLASVSSAFADPAPGNNTTACAVPVLTPESAF